VKVLHVISGDLWAGAEAQAATLLSQLSLQRGVSITAIIFNEGELASRLRGLAIEVFVIDEQKHGTPASFLRLLVLLRQLQPDIVHTHRIKENILGSVAAAMVTAAKGVRTVHGSAEHSFRGWRNLHRHLLGSFDGWCGAHLQSATIAVSKELGIAYACQHPKQKVVVIENGVAVDLASDGSQTADWKLKRPDALHIGIAGRLVPVKRVDIFIDMAGQLLRQNPYAWQFHIFGDGPLRRQLTEQANAGSLADKVIFQGQVADLASHLRSLDALIICSDHEGLPMVALEALAVKTPVLAHAVGGLRDLLDEQLLISDNRPSCYVDKLTHLLKSRADAGAPLVRVDLPDKYTANYNARQVLGLYSRLQRD